MECHTFEPYTEPQSPQKIMEENTLAALYRLPRAFRLENILRKRRTMANSVESPHLTSMVNILPGQRMVPMLVLYSIETENSALLMSAVY